MGERERLNAGMIGIRRECNFVPSIAPHHLLKDDEEEEVGDADE